MTNLKNMIVEMMESKLNESVEITRDYSQAPKSEKADIPKDVNDWATTRSTPKKEIKVDYSGGVKHKDGSMHLSIFHHKNGHTYIRDHSDGNVYKSNKPAKHKPKDVLKSYAHNTAEDEKNFKSV